jgi:hypothetical protein
LISITAELAERRGLPGAAGLLKGFGDGEKEFFFAGAADELDTDGEALGRNREGNGKTGEASEI